MDSFENRLLNTWPARQWRDVTLMVAVSGGADSVALLRALHNLRGELRAGRFVVAHYNHGLRGEESQADADFVRELAERLSLECISGAAPQRSLETVSEDDARTERYQFLTAAATECGARYVALAHTANDQAETILFRILRGTGIQGLAGMPCTRALSPMVSLIRPLLDFTRSEIVDYLSRLSQGFRTDSSNVSQQYARNRVRLELLPLLREQYHPDIERMLLSLGQQAAEIVAETEREIEQHLPNVVELEHAGFVMRVPRAKLLTPRLVREMLVHLWRQYAWPRGEMSFIRWQELYQLLWGTDDVRMFPGAIRVEKKGESLLVTRLEKN
jgi:tRNA(Ile)-lysidine synthase